jgi:muconolactone delta-isomerase
MLLSVFHKFSEKLPSGKVIKMKKPRFIHFLFLICAFLSVSLYVGAQTRQTPEIKSMEISETDGVPVLIKHLPEWEKVRKTATFTNNTDELRKALGDRPVFDLIDFSGGTEATAAPYAQGKLLIIEYTTPQASSDMDAKTVQRLSEIGQNQRIFYRRIGNYNAFVFDAPDEAAANQLLDQVKYEKEIQWLGENPFIRRAAEKAFIATTSDIFIATVMAIVLGIGVAIVTGLITGIIFYYVREQRRSTMEAFSDAGGMTRLNLDDLSADIIPKGFLKE